MTNVQTFIVEPGTPELAICARWRANAFSALQASFEEELSSLKLFASDQTRGVALVAKADDEPIGMCLLVDSEIEPNHDVSPWLAGLSPNIADGAQAPYWFEPSRIKRASKGFRGCCTSTPQRLARTMRGSVVSRRSHQLEGL
ncbi:hypothetical protein QA641_15325 [Bradyrhizobium sp. CB1650]|uniref:hypothetical protein n=1 Tax=Bradyrhizobium sp. CB1650 TaxID=3039153 RepID=UPI0024355816|nr:hypothetical protein [Bradyrhizobium sp. CB1650]WGD55136.1 hypothetical protein QA641_15325 [Bradyrhizobium sp. CB1650]